MHIWLVFVTHSGALHAFAALKGGSFDSWLNPQSEEKSCCGSDNYYSTSSATVSNMAVMGRSARHLLLKEVRPSMDPFSEPSTALFGCFQHNLFEIFYCKILPALWLFSELYDETRNRRFFFSTWCFIESLSVTVSLSHSQCQSLSQCHQLNFWWSRAELTLTATCVGHWVSVSQSYWIHTHVGQNVNTSTLSFHHVSDDCHCQLHHESDAVWLTVAI